MQTIIDPAVRLINFRADAAERSGRASCVPLLRKLVERSFSDAVRVMALTFCRNGSVTLQFNFDVTSVPEPD